MLIPATIQQMRWAEATQWLLQQAYERPCFACGRRGLCQHREPRVEMAILGRTRAEVPKK